MSTCSSDASFQAEKIVSRFFVLRQSNRIVENLSRTKYQVRVVWSQLALFTFIRQGERFITRSIVW